MGRLGSALFVAVFLIAQAPTHATSATPAHSMKGQIIVPGKSNDAAPSPQRGTKDAPLFVETHVSGKLQTSADQTTQNARDEKNPWLDPITIFTFLLVLVGAGQVYFLRNTDRATTKAADAAKASADAVVSQLRAYLSVGVKEGFPPAFDPESGPYCAFEIKNTGQTPAFKMTMWIHAAIGSLDAAGPFIDGEDEATAGETTLSPGASIDLAARGPAPQGDDAQAFADGRKAAYVWGEIKYIDAFERKRFHNFRYTFTAGDLKGSAVQLRMCSGGNEAN